MRCLTSTATPCLVQPPFQLDKFADFWGLLRICPVTWGNIVVGFLAFIEDTVLVAEWFGGIFEPPVQSR